MSLLKLEKLIIVGTGTSAVQVLSFIKYHNLFEVIGFAVNKEYKKNNEFHGLPVYTLETLREECPDKDFKLFVSVQWNHLNRDRKIIYQYCKEQGYKMANVISPNAIIRCDIQSENIYIDDNVIIMNGVYLGNNCYLKASCVCGPNVKVSDHCFLGFNSIIGGGSTIGEQCFIGLNATIFDDTSIGNKCIIGACTAVKRNIPDYSRYVTSSDNIIIKQYSPEEIESKLISSKNVR